MRKSTEALNIEFRSGPKGAERRSLRYKRKVDVQSVRTWLSNRQWQPGDTYAVLPVVQTGFGPTAARTPALRPDRRLAHIGQGGVRHGPQQLQTAKSARLPRPLLPNATKSKRFTAPWAAHVPFAALSAVDCRHCRAAATSRLLPAPMPPCAAQRILAEHGMPKLAAANSAERAQREWSPRPRRRRELATSEPQRAPSMPCSCPVPLEPPSGHRAARDDREAPSHRGRLRGPRPH